MQVNWHKLLTALGSTVTCQDTNVKQQCPLHPATSNSLEVIDPNGHVRFRCCASQCRFEGDSVQLASLVHRISILAALDLFRPEQPLCDCLPVWDEQLLTSYKDQLNVKLRIDAYLTRCQCALRQIPEVSRLRTGLSRNNIQLLPAEVGLVDRTDVPSYFGILTKQTYQRGNHLIYPFTFDEQVTHVRIQNVDRPDSFLQPLPVTCSDLGVFMEANIQDDTDLIVSFNPRVATLLYGEYAAESMRRPPICAVAGFPLPSRASRLRSINLLNCVDAPLTLVDALRVLKAPVLIGSVKQPDVFVCEATDSNTLTSEHIRSYMAHPRTRVPLSVWIIDEMKRAVRTDNVESVCGAVVDSGITQEQLTNLRTGVTDAALSELLRTVTIANVERIQLGNGLALKRTPAGLRAIVGKEEKPLSNFNIDVEHKINTATDALYVCRVTPADTSIPPVTVRLRETDYNSAKALTRHIRRVLDTRDHKSSYVTAYTLTSMDWSDILARLGTHCEIRTEVAQLGACDRIVAFPYCSLDIARQTIETQQDIFDIPAPVMNMYAGLRPNAAPDASSAYRRLFEHADNPFVAGLIVGLMHVFYCVALDLRYNGYPTRRHCLFVETEIGIWQPVFRQLAQLFGDNPDLVQLRTASALAELEKYTALGPLPWLGCIPTLREERFDRLMSDVPLNLLGLVSSTTAGAVDTGYNLMFCVPPQGLSERGCLEPAAMLELQQALPGFLLETLNKIEVDSAFRYAREPALHAYQSVCQVLGTPVCQTVLDLAKPYYTGLGAANADMFFQRMHHMYASSNELSVCYGEPTGFKRAQYINVFVCDEYVSINKGILTLLNRGRTGPRFNATALGVEFEMLQVSSQPSPSSIIDPARYLTITREAWEQRVVRTPIQLAPIEQTPSLRLISIAAES